MHKIAQQIEEFIKEAQTKLDRTIVDEQDIQLIDKKASELLEQIKPQSTKFFRRII